MTSRFTFLFQDGYLRQGKQCWGRYLLGVFSRHHYIKCVEKVGKLLKGMMSFPYVFSRYTR